SPPCGHDHLLGVRATLQFYPVGDSWTAYAHLSRDVCRGGGHAPLQLCSPSCPGGSRHGCPSWSPSSHPLHATKRKHVVTARCSGCPHSWQRSPSAISNAAPTRPQ